MFCAQHLSVLGCKTHPKSRLLAWSRFDKIGNEVVMCAIRATHEEMDAHVKLVDVALVPVQVELPQRVAMV